MKVLLRKHDDKYYVWKKAKYENDKYIVINDDGTETSVYQIGILAIKEDNRKNYVKCINCGALIKNTPESIEKHYQQREASRNCLTCGYLSTYGNPKNIKTKYVKNADGSYRRTIVCDTGLRCKKASWYSTVDINNPDAATTCVYNRCRLSGVSKISDIFMEYPDLFDKQITADTLMLNKYTCAKFDGNYFEYDLKCRGTLVANVNELGIVDHFTIKYSNETYYLYYSAKYDLLFFADGGQYSMVQPYELSTAKYNQAKEKIAALYKEASK